MNPETTAAEHEAKGSRITLAMLVRNEEDRYLERVLGHAARYISRAVILDDASEDGSVEECRRILRDVPLVLVSNSEPSFGNEIVLRKQLWNLAVETEPDWILVLDADEVFEDRAVVELPRLAAEPVVDVYAFRLFDLWDEGHYRENQYWNGHYNHHPVMVRYRKDFHYQWREATHHCGRLPMNARELPGAPGHLRIKHLGWMRPADRLAKYRRYLELDPGGRRGNLAQYLSIQDPAPNLVAWVEDPRYDLLESRVFVRSDPHTRRLVFDLPPGWWSAPYAYEWAGHLCAAADVVLDAGGGVPGPFQFHLADICREVHACDADGRILSPLAIQSAVAEVFGAETAGDLPARYLDRITRTQAPLASLPYESGKFDKIFCLEIMDRLAPEELTPSLDECWRTLKDDGLLVMTFTCPSPILNRLYRTPLRGWTFASSVSFAPLPDAVTRPGGEACYCFRAVLRKRSIPRQSRAPAPTSSAR